jgi:hypothetical protein
MKSRRLAAFAVLLASAGGLTACGNKQDRITNGETEGAYVDVGPLKYQVQISRQLNPTGVEDRSYFRGLSANDLQLPPDQTYFGVFMRVENQSGKPALTASDFTIEDTQHNEFKPLAISAVNPLGYHPQVLGDEHHLPDPDSVQAFSPAQGGLLLFKLPNASLDNRPLELIIKSPGAVQQTGTVNLDV